MDIWKAYKLGIKLTLGTDRTMGRLPSLMHHPALIPRCLTPIDYVRYREFDFAFKAIKEYKPNPNTLLDVSSPKLFPLTIAQTNPKAHIFSIELLKDEVKQKLRAAETLGIHNFEATVQDARSLACDSDRFEAITSLSVLEHIAPENGGDISAAKELGRVTSPGGIAIITVPFAKSHFAEYKDGTVYERTANTEEKLFFQRFYDHNLLLNNIVKSSGLSTLEMQFIEERCFKNNSHKRLAQLINSTTKQNALFGPLFPIFSGLFLSRPRPLEKCRKPYIACLVLKKR